MWITKASGKMEKFNINKVRRTCIRAGASRELADTIAKQVRQRVKSGMTTREILDITLSLLKREMPHVAKRYDLKGALLRLGPGGFNFETLIAHLLREYGYKTKVHSMVKGGSEVMHEIDVVAAKPIKVPEIIKEPNMKYFPIECKYHNSPGIFTGIKDVLYTYARFLDLQDGFKKGYCHKFNNSWLATNTKFSRDAINYAIAKNIKLLSWDHPKGESLRELMMQKSLYPVTVLRKLDTNTQGKLANADIILLNTLLKKDIKTLNKKTGISVRKLKELVAESEKIIH